MNHGSWEEISKQIYTKMYNNHAGTDCAFHTAMYYHRLLYQARNALWGVEIVSNDGGNNML